ncbi:opioid growth factor receptor-related protein [Marinobacter sp. AN1]|uniref:opioid growth factor receptor-related protein n=1 Tax=Marinobacter sp. AN1 TaxID=2886046 RepID=UPI00222E3631|nr:opioid growth factor receptor-related protein [Marinobacter sp. AN1]UZD64640.1 opioid growth factor receptor-related protein [Marinobacter sp. AN1]
MTASPDWPAICVYSSDRWGHVRTQLEALPNMEPEARRLQRRMLGHAHSMDPNERLQVSAPLAELAGVSDKTEPCWLIGFNPDTAELWTESNLIRLAAGELDLESHLIRFFRGGVGDHKGRTFEDILALEDFWLEHTHDVIQWLFPIPERSVHKPSAPVLTEGDRRCFAIDEQLRQQHRSALDRMLAFYGLTRRGNKIEALPELNPKDHIWLKTGGHNHLRISRIIRSLQYCHQQELAKAVQQAFVSIGSERGFVSPRSVEYWLRATD